MFIISENKRNTGKLDNLKLTKLEIMIRKLFLLMLFATCSYSLFGQSSFYHRMETAIDLGVCDSTYYYGRNA